MYLARFSKPPGKYEETMKMINLSYPISMSLLHTPIRLVIFPLACLLAVLACAIPAHASEPSLAIAAAYPYDASLGWQQPQADFHWPGSRDPAVLLRFTTADYLGLRDVRLRIEACSAAGTQVLRRTETLRLPAGSFEYTADKLGLADDPFYAGVLHFTVYAALEDGPEASAEFDVTLFAPPPPSARFTSLSFSNPGRKQNLTRLFPGDEFVIEGEVAVDANPTPLHPVLYIGALLANEGAPLGLAQPASVNALNWGRVVLDAPAGKWRFTVHGRLPRAFPAGATQPVQFVAAVRWSPTAIVQASLDAQVQDPGLGFDTSRVANERLIVLDPAWEWELTPAASG
jgi:hypothetical protein